MRGHGGTGEVTGSRPIENGYLGVTLISYRQGGRLKQAESNERVSIGHISGNRNTCIVKLYGMGAGDVI